MLEILNLHLDIKMVEQVTPTKLSKFISSPKIPNANQMLISYFPHITI